MHDILLASVSLRAAEPPPREAAAATFHKSLEEQSPFRAGQEGAGSARGARRCKSIGWGMQRQVGLGEKGGSEMKKLLLGWDWNST